MGFDVADTSGVLDVGDDMVERLEAAGNVLVYAAAEEEYAEAEPSVSVVYVVLVAYSVLVV